MQAGGGGFQYYVPGGQGLPLAAPATHRCFFRTSAAALLVPQAAFSLATRVLAVLRELAGGVDLPAGSLPFDFPTPADNPPIFQVMHI
jgi:hypothetical protein